MLLIKGGRIIDPLSGADGTGDILIDGEKIVKIGKDISCGCKVIDAGGLAVCPGFVDIHSHFRDPGQTHKEDIYTGAAAAAAGGYTTVICMANTLPPVDNADTLQYILDRAKDADIEVLQAACITQGLRGGELTDFDALLQAGAVGFSDDGKGISNPQTVLEAMREAAKSDAVLSFHEEDSRLIEDPGVNSGPAAARLGLKGAPAAAEEILIARDAVLAAETGCRIHIQHVSSALSVDMIRQAKRMGAHITAEATPHHLSLTEVAVHERGTSAKVNPPLRAEQDRLAIIAGLKDGTIDAIATDHAPHAAAEKDVPFAQAPSGMIGLETAFAVCMTYLVRPGHITLNQLIYKLTAGPAGIYSLDRGYIREGGRADITIFDPAEEWQVSGFRSKSANSPYMGAQLTGKIKKTICSGRVVYTEERGKRIDDR